MAICHFLKPETNKGDFRLYFVLVEKNCRGRHHSEILKTNTKTLIYSIWIRPQGSLGCQKVCQGPLNMLFEVFIVMYLICKLIHERLCGNWKQNILSSHYPTVLISVGIKLLWNLPIVMFYWSWSYIENMSSNNIYLDTFLPSRMNEWNEWMKDYSCWHQAIAVRSNQIEDIENLMPYPCSG